MPMTQAQILIEAIKENCEQCADLHRGEVATCGIPDCPLYPYRLGDMPSTAHSGHVLDGNE